MSHHLQRYDRSLLWLLLIGSLAVLLPSVEVQAQNNLFGQRSVGGISIDVNGVIKTAELADRRVILEQLKREAGEVAAELSATTELRKVSLRKIQEQLREILKDENTPIPDEIRYLGGLQRIQYILVYPERNDIVLAGPGEGWKINEQNGDVVGITTGRPVLRLDYLLTALRAVEAARTEGISVSIDPTTEGLQAFNAVLKRQRTFTRAAVEQLAKAMGPQDVTYTGIPVDSQMARVLVAADYRMKRYAMNHEAAPVAGMPGYLELLRAARRTPKNSVPRFWMACNYQSLARTEDSLAWEIKGQGVKALTEEEFVAGGEIRATGGKDVQAEQWAKTLTEKFEQLADKDSAFADLRNVMDVCVVAAVIARENLIQRAGADFSLLTNGQSDLTTEQWAAVRTAPTQCNALQIGRSFVITASGGVQVESWQVAENNEVDNAVEAVRTKAAPTDESGWCWN